MVHTEVAGEAIVYRRWRAPHICSDSQIRADWKKKRITPLQIGGVWLFGRWRSSRDRALLEPIASMFAAELAKSR